MAGTRFVNPFTPRSQIGEGMGHIMTALFAGQHPGVAKGVRSAAQEAEDKAQAEMYLAKAGLDRQTAAARAGLGAAFQSALDRRNASRTRPMSIDLVGGDDGLGLRLDGDTMANMLREATTADEPIVRPMRLDGDVLARALDATDNPTPQTWMPPPRPSMPVVNEAGDVTLPSRPAQPMPQPGLRFGLDGLGLRLPDEMPAVRQSYGAPGPVSQDDELAFALALAAAASKAALTSNPDQIAGSVGRFQSQGQERGLLNGTVTPEQWFLLNGKPLQDVQDGYQVSRTSMDEPNPLGTALSRMETEASRQGELESRIPVNEARVATEGKRQGLLDEQIKNQPSVRDRNAAAAEKFRQPPTAKAAGRGVAPKKFDVQTIEGEIAALLQEATGEQNIDAELLNHIKARAMELFAESGDHFDAAAQAVEEVKNGIEVEGEWNPFKKNRIVPKAGLGPPRAEPAPVTSPGMRAPAAPSFPPAPKDKAQRKPGAIYMTPKGPMTWTGTGWLPPA